MERFLEDSGVQNSIVDIKDFLDSDTQPLQPDEFRMFWNSLTDEEKAEFRKTDLPKT